MSSFIKDGYYCIDNYFGPRQYGFVKMTEEEDQAKLLGKWDMLDFNTLEGRGGTRQVLRTIPSEFQNVPKAINK